MKLILPLPPSINGYWLHIPRKRSNGSTYVDTALGPKGKEFVLSVQADVLQQIGRCDPLKGRLSARVLICPKSEGTDLDNYMKALLDSLTKAKVWVDDSQIDRLLVERGPTIPEIWHYEKTREGQRRKVVDRPGGRCEISIAVISGGNWQKKLFEESAT